MEPKDIELLVHILAALEENQEGYLKDLARRAALPEEWRGVIQWQGASRLDAQVLIDKALVRSLYCLGNILHVVLKEDVGVDKGIELAILIVRYGLYNDEELLRELKEDKSLLRELKKKGSQDFDSLVQRPSLSNNLPSIAIEVWEQLKSILEKLIDSEEEEENFFAIQEACRKTLSRSERHYAQTINTVDQVLKRLNEYNSRNGVPRIAEFAFHLTKDSDIDKVICEEIEAWLRKYCFKQPTISNLEKQSLLEPRLFIWIEEKCGKAQENPFSVQAWLVPDSPWLISDSEVTKKAYQSGEYYKINFSYLFSIFDLNDLLKDKDFLAHVSPSFLEKINQEMSQGFIKIDQLDLSLEELKELFSLIMGETLLLLLQEKTDFYGDNLDTSKLAIEIFLPEKLLNTNIDQWIIFDLSKKYEQRIYPIGTSFRVILRSLERSTKRHQKKMSRRDAKKAQLLQIAEEQPWRLKWKSAINKLNSIPDKDDFEFIHQVDALDDEYLRIQLKKRIGVMLGCCSERNNILKMIINDEGIPIVLWTRCDDLTTEQVDELDKLIHSDYLLYLPERVLNKRSETRSKNCLNSHLGFHLVMLWDDPNRFPPNVTELID